MKKNVLAFCLIALSSCGYKDMENKLSFMSAENDSLRKVLVAAKDSLNDALAELEGFRNEPEKLCANLSSLRSFADTTELYSILDRLKKYHPESGMNRVVSLRIDSLKTALRKKQEEERKQRLVSVSKLRKKVDDVQGMTWYHNPYFIHYENSNRLSIYIVEVDGLAWLRMKMSYAGDDWLFVNDAYLSCDGETKRVEFDEHKEKHSKVGYGEVYEWVDVPIERPLFDFLKKMANGDKLKMQFFGESYSHTRTLTSDEKRGIKDVLLAFDVLIHEPGMSTFSDLKDDE